MKNNKPLVTTPFWRDNRIIPILLQLLFVLVVLLAGFYFISNAIAGLDRIGIKLGFSFLKNPASFSIGESLIDYTPSDSYGRAIVVGILNTIKVSIIGIFFASILGTIIGIARISNNWLARQFANLYIEIIRNTPLLVQIFIWYFAVFLELPKVKDSIKLPGGIYLSNRGTAIPWFKANTSLSLWIVFIIIGILLAIVFWKIKLTAQIKTGKRKYPGIWSIGSFFLTLLVALLVIREAPVSIDYPTLGKFNFQGGHIITPEFSSILVGLVLYTATYIGEIVRGGILSVSKGQIEAAKALGLKNSTTLRLVIFPQAIRVIIPPVTSQYLNLAKNSSLAVAIGYPDLVSVGGTVLNQTGRAVEMITVMILVYLSMSLFTSFIMNMFNKHTQLVER